MRKTYILDTSVLIDDPGAYKHFADSEVIIPIIVINELDKKKLQPGEAGRNARVCCRLLDTISEAGNTTNGILIDNNILVKIDSTYYNLDEDCYKGFGNPDYPDTQILASAYHNNMVLGEGVVTFVSNDVNLRIKARTRGIKAISHDSAKCLLSDIYAGIQTIKNETVGLDLQKRGVIDPAECELDMFPNECAYFTGDNGDGIALARKVAKDKLKTIKKTYPWNLSSRNKEQTFAIDLIMDKNIDLVTLIGRAGTGKSLVVLATALELVINRKEYEKFVIYRPIQSVGNDIGFLPGTLEEKLAPWFHAIMDNFETLFQSKNGGDWRRELEMYQKRGKIEMEAITYIRGRSIPNAIILLDECFPYSQNIETDGGKKHIGILYDMWKQNKELPLVKTYNETTHQFEYKKITHAWNRGKKNLIQIICGNRKIKCTENHQFLTSNGWTEAKNLHIGDLIKTTIPESHQLLHSLNEDQLQIVLGSFLGEGNISNHGINRYRLRVTHGKQQEEYCKWKAFIFGSNTKEIINNGYSKKPAIRFSSKIFGLDNEFPRIKTICPQWVLDKLDARGLAIWFMDDGSVQNNVNATISTCSFDEDSQKRMVKKLNSMGIKCEYKFCKLNGKRSPGYYSIFLNKEGYLKLCQIISPYVHSDLHYKIYDSINNKEIGSYVWSNKFNNNGLTVVDNIQALAEQENVYDLEIADNHNFIVCSSSRKTLGGLIAHNCQNLTKEEVKTVLTRAGENTKIILTGDIEQIDNSVLDATSNGLTYVIEKFKNSELAGHITFMQGERSKLATLASEIL